MRASAECIVDANGSLYMLDRADDMERDRRAPDVVEVAVFGIADEGGRARVKAEASVTWKETRRVPLRSRKDRVRGTSRAVPGC
jgi:hypothetical protein